VALVSRRRQESPRRHLRRPRRTLPGAREAHAATIRQIAERDGRELVFERKPVNDKFTLQDLQRIKDPERNAAYVQAIRAWLEAGKPKDALPLSLRGDVIRKVRLLTNKNVDVEVRGGAADRGEMARVDVFRKKTPRGAWQYFLVPVYPHQIATLDQPPMRAVTAHKPETSWPVMDASSEFLWSVASLQLVEVVKSDERSSAGIFAVLIGRAATSRYLPTTISKKAAAASERGL
jgi:CRISPR-associated endonuclease Csn1